MQIGIGNNLVETAPGTNNVIMVGGARLFTLESGGGPALTSLNIWDAEGDHVARLRRGAWAFNKPDYEVTTDPDHFTLTDGDRVIAEILRPRPDYLWLRQADVYAQNGVRVLVGPDNEFDLEIQADSKSLVRLRRCHFKNPTCVLDVVDSGKTQLMGQGVRASRAYEGLVIEDSTFAG